MSKRWRDVLAPELTSKKPWSGKEDALLLELLEKLGPRWTAIADKLPGRSPIACRNRSRKFRKQRPEPSEFFSALSPRPLLSFRLIPRRQAPDTFSASCHVVFAGVVEYPSSRSALTPQWQTTRHRAPAQVAVAASQAAASRARGRAPSRCPR